MKLISYQYDGTESYGAVVGDRSDRVVDLREIFGDRAGDLKALVGSSLIPAASKVARNATVTLLLDTLQLLPVIPNPGKIVCVGLNYGEHVRESGREATEQPALFLRVAESQLAHGEDIVVPLESSRLDYEGEIAIVIGQGGRRIAEADAWKHIAGYACYNDGSIRDWQSATSQWTAGKNFSSTGAFGP